MKKLKQIDYDLREKLKKVEMDEDIAMLGFECKGLLVDYKGYEEFFYKLWLWTMEEEDGIYTVVTADCGNTYCTVVYEDLFIPELCIA